MKILTKKYILRLFGFGFILWLSGSYLGSRIATNARPVKIPPANIFFSQPVENQQFTSADGIEISSWFLPNQSKKAVILLNGIGGNRTGLIAHAKFYQQYNYNILMPDLRATGESGGDVITFGWQERYDLEACVDFLKKNGMDTIGVHGMSLGAATIVYSFQENPDYAFVVLESCYDNISNALNNRVEQFPFPTFFYSALEEFTEWRVEAESEKLAPEDYMQFCKYPTFILAGDSEKKVKKTETEKLFKKCAAITKDLHFFEGAYHENFTRRFGVEWTEEMRKWIEKFEADL